MIRRAWIGSHQFLRGWIEEIGRFAEEGLGVTLSISLHAASDEKRVTIMPTAKNIKYVISPDASENLLFKNKPAL